MFERYSLTVSRQALTERFSVDVPDTFVPRYNAAPSQLLPVITHENPEGISVFYWGTSPEWSKNKTISERIINVRLEQIREKPVILKSLMKRRCLVPADGYYHWKKVGKKTMIPYRYTLPEKGLFAFPGLWEEYDDDEGNFFHTFSIITYPMEAVGQPPDRWPVILSKEGEQIWLSKESEQEELLTLLKPAAAGQLTSYSISHKINSLLVDNPTLIIPTPPADQFGNLTLFDQP